MPTDSTPSRAQRATDGLLVLIVLAVGLMAAAASFHHVHDWTMHNSPTGTAGWFGWANAVITELIPTAALIIITRRRKTGGRIGYPMFLLIIAVGLSLTAQLAVARPTVFGWMVSALPALAFFALSKLVFTATKATPAPGPVATPPVPADADALASLAARLHDLETRPLEGLALTPAASAPAPSSDTAPAKARPAAKKTPAKTTTPRKSTPSKKTNPPAKAAPAVALRTDPAVRDGTAPIAAATPVDQVTQLLPGARIFAEAHQQAHGQPITPGQLAVRMRIDTTKAEHILDELAKVGTQPTTAPHNGTPVEVPA
jgi:hypothetical protein